MNLHLESKTGASGTHTRYDIDANEDGSVREVLADKHTRYTQMYPISANDLEFD